MINKRKLKIIVRRLTHAPSIGLFFPYLINSLRILLANAMKSGRVPHPNSLTVELTNRCQLRCVTCPREYRYGKKMNVGDMPLEEFKKLYDQSYKYLDRIGLSGLGESLLYPELGEAIDYIRSRNRGIAIFISTNAHHARTVELLGELSDRIDTIQVSVDGVGETFEKIRKNGAFPQFERNVRGLVERTSGKGCSIKLNMVVFEQNGADLPHVVRWAHAVGVRELHCSLLSPITLDMPLNPSGYYKSGVFLEHAETARAEAGKLGINLSIGQATDSAATTRCPYLWNNFYITWDGYLVPCCAKPFPLELNFGNVFKDGLMRCLNGEAFVTFRKNAKRGVIHPFCAGCLLPIDA